MKDLVSYIQDSVDFGQVDEFYLDLQLDAQGIKPNSKGKDYHVERLSDSIRSFNGVTKPYPGLRPFKTSESFLFFGREDLEKDILKKLQRSRFLAVIGASGTGKSSLIRAGLVPNLHWGYLPSDTTEWKICACRPGMNPLDNLAVALTFSDHYYFNRSINDSKKAFKKNVSLLRSDPYALSEVLNSDNIYRNTLIIVDQFEELFKFYEDNHEQDKKEEAELFVDQLLNATAQEFDNNIYVILTMRSEFLGSAVLFKGLSENINQNQYLVPKLSRHQLISAIEFPAKIFGKKVSPILSKKLSEEIVENQDQLPVLQHALMRTYLKKFEKHEIEDSDDEISLEDYRNIGQIQMALSEHADSIYDSLDGPGQEIAKSIFQCITDKNDTRRPLVFRDLVDILSARNCNEDQIKDVIDKFRGEDCSFIIPPPSITIGNNTIIDISHESLIRLWGRLRKWFNKEVENGNIYKSVQSRRRFNDKHEVADPISSGMLKLVESWWSKQKPNYHWAKRYHDKDEIMALTDSSLDKKQTSVDELNKINAEIFSLNHIFFKDSLKKSDNKNRIIKNLVIGSFIFLFTAVISLLYIWNQARQSEDTAKSERQRAENAENEALAALDDANSERERAENAENEALAALGVANIERERAENAENDLRRALERSRQSENEAKRSEQVASYLSDSIRSKNQVLDSIYFDLLISNIEKYLTQASAHANELNSKLEVYSLLKALKISNSEPFLDSTRTNKLDSVKKVLGQKLSSVINNGLIFQSNELTGMKQVQLIDQNLFILRESGVLSIIDLIKGTKEYEIDFPEYVYSKRGEIDSLDSKTKLFVELFNNTTNSVDIIVRLNYSKNVQRNRAKSQLQLKEQKPNYIVAVYRVKLSGKFEEQFFYPTSDPDWNFNSLDSKFSNQKLFWDIIDFGHKKKLFFFNSFYDRSRRYSLDFGEKIITPADLIKNENPSIGLRYYSSVNINGLGAIGYRTYAGYFYLDSSMENNLFTIDLNCRQVGTSDYRNLSNKNYTFDFVSNRTRFILSDECIENTAPRLYISEEGYSLELNGEQHTLPFKIHEFVNNIFYSDYIDSDNILMVTRDRYYVWNIKSFKGAISVNDFISELGELWALTQKDSEINSLDRDFSNSLSFIIQ